MHPRRSLKARLCYRPRGKRFLGCQTGLYCRINITLSEILDKSSKMNASKNNSESYAFSVQVGRDF
jgi:hypothetical protein